MKAMPDVKITVVTHVVGSIKKGTDMMGGEKRAELTAKAPGS